MKNQNQFEATKTMFVSALDGYISGGNISYGEWMGIPDDLKAIALYVQFYDSITLAWAKTRCTYITDDEEVSVLLQYIQKNVDKIKNDQKRYTGPYMYTVGYKCMGSLRRKSNEQTRYNMTSSRYTTNESGEEIDILEKYVKEDDPEVIDKTIMKDFWASMDKQPKIMQEVIESMVNGTRSLVKKPEKMEILNHLRTTFSEYRQLYLNTEMTFQSVYNVDDNVSSAVVEMEDGELAVYYGQKGSLHEELYIEFFGAKKDYIIPYETAKNFRVIDVQLY